MHPLPHTPAMHASHNAHPPCHACPHPLPYMPSFTTHAPPFTMHAPLHHACSPSPYMPIPFAMHAPTPGKNDWHTLLKILPCPKLRLQAVITDCTQQKIDVLQHQFVVYCLCKTVFIHIIYHCRKSDILMQEQCYSFFLFEVFLNKNFIIWYYQPECNWGNPVSLWFFCKVCTPRLSFSLV